MKRFDASLCHFHPFGESLADFGLHHIHVDKLASVLESCLGDKALGRGLLETFSLISLT